MYGTRVAASGTPAVQYSTTLANNTWAQIQKAAKEGKASSLWSVGDEINITLTGTYAQTLTLQIADFNHDASNSITFVCKHLMTSKQRMNASDTNSGGWDNTEMFNTTLPAILSCLPSDLKSVIKSVTKSTGTGGGSTSGTETSTNKLFLLSEKEVGLSSYSVGNEGTQYPIFTDNNSRIKKLSNGSGSADVWWLRSPFSGNSYSFCFVGSGGSAYCNVASHSRGVCFGFCVG